MGACTLPPSSIRCYGVEHTSHFVNSSEALLHISPLLTAAFINPPHTPTPVAYDGQQTGNWLAVALPTVG